MMPDLFSQNWAIDDPSTSEEAGRRVTASGKRARHAAIVLDLVKAHPGSTYAELAAKQTGPDPLNPHEVMRRLNDLKIAGLVHQAEKRSCRIRGTTMMTWHPGTAQPSGARN